MDRSKSSKQRVKEMESLGYFTVGFGRARGTKIMS
jgi:hypothetical protein